MFVEFLTVDIALLLIRRVSIYSLFRQRHEKYIFAKRARNSAYILSLSTSSQANLITVLNNTSWYLDDILNLDIPFLDSLLVSFYPKELDLETNYSLILWKKKKVDLILMIHTINCNRVFLRSPKRRVSHGVAIWGRIPPLRLNTADFESPCGLWGTPGTSTRPVILGERTFDSSLWCCRPNIFTHLCKILDRLFQWSLKYYISTKGTQE